MKQTPSVFISHSRLDKFKLARLNDQIFQSRSRLFNLDRLSDDRVGRYYKKLAKYWQELDRCKNDRLALDFQPKPTEGYLAQMFYAFDDHQKKRLESRQNLLQQLVDVGVKLVATCSDDYLEIKFQALELELDGLFVCIDGFDYSFSAPGADVHHEVRKFLRKKIKENVRLWRAQVRILITKIRFIFMADLRQRIRSHMQFLFKNMDDCSGDHNALPQLQTLNFITNNFSNGKYKRTYSHLTEMSRY